MQISCLAEFFRHGVQVVHMKASIFHDGHQIPSPGADRSIVYPVLYPSHIKQELTGVDINEANNSILT